MPLHNSSYQHWDGSHLGIWRRRAAIGQAGLKGCLQAKWMRYVVTVCWSGALVQVAFVFFLGQLLIADSLIVRWLGNAGGQLKTLAVGLMRWLEQHPEISVRTTQNLLFYLFSTSLLTMSLMAIALAMPHLITRDLSSRAIIIYASKAVSRFDYLLGKFATVFGLLVLTWLGPVCVAWFFGNLLSPNWGFFWHSRLPLANALLFVLAGMFILSLLALGVSAASGKEKATVSLWIGLWLVGNALVGISHTAKPWLRFFSLRFDLDQLSLAVFQLGRELKLVEENLPVFGQMFRGVSQQATTWQHPQIAGAACGLAGMLLLAILLIAWRVRPE